MAIVGIEGERRKEVVADLDLLSGLGLAGGLGLLLLLFLLSGGGGSDEFKKYESNRAKWNKSSQMICPLNANDISFKRK